MVGFSSKHLICFFRPEICVLFYPNQVRVVDRCVSRIWNFLLLFELWLFSWYLFDFQKKIEGWANPLDTPLVSWLSIIFESFCAVPSDFSRKSCFLLYETKKIFPQKFKDQKTMNLPMPSDNSKQIPKPPTKYIFLKTSIQIIFQM